MPVKTNMYGHSDILTLSIVKGNKFVKNNDTLEIVYKDTVLQFYIVL